MRKTAKVFLYTVWMLFFLVSTTSALGAGQAVKNLKQGWTQELIYEHGLVFPASLTVNTDGDLLVFDAAFMKVKLLALDGSLHDYADLSPIPHDPLAIAYQEQHARLLVFTNTGELYAHSNGQLSVLGTGALSAKAVAVDSRDDSFYAAVPTDSGSFLNHYDSNGNFLSTITSGLQEVSQIALDEDINRLYYSEPFAGQVVEIDLNDYSSKVIAQNIGIPGTFEPISVMLDGVGDLYYYTADQGLNKYQDGSFAKIMDALSGAGPMVWSPLFAAFVQAQLAGANFVSYDPFTLEFGNLTQGINGDAIVEMNNGMVLVCSEGASNVLRIGESGLTVFSEDLPSRCTTLERDESGEVYAGLQNGQIITVAEDGTTAAWAQVDLGNERFTIHYDKKHSSIVSITRSLGDNITRFWRTKLDNPTNSELFMVLEGITSIAGALDDQGNIYVLDRNVNVIYEIIDGTDQPVIFASNVLDSEAITGPGMEYLTAEEALVVSTILTYELWPLSDHSKLLLAANNGGVDNFAVNETKDYGLICIHSGRAFKLSLDADGDSIPDSRDSCPEEKATDFDVDGDGCIDTLSGLTEMLETLVTVWAIEEELQTSLLTKVQNAQSSTDRENFCAAINQLEALINQVDAQKGKKISDDSANKVIAYTDSVVAYFQSQLSEGKNCS